jgi:hypothetical protein
MRPSDVIGFNKTVSFYLAYPREDICLKEKVTKTKQKERNVNFIR